MDQPTTTKPATESTVAPAAPRKPWQTPTAQAVDVSSLTKNFAGFGGDGITCHS